MMLRFYSFILISLLIVSPPLAGELKDKADEFQRITERDHLREGLLIPTVYEVTDGPKEFTGSSREDCCTRTGEYVFAQSMRYAVTQDPAAREQAAKSAQALLTLERVTGVPGVVGRCFEKRSGPSIEEQAFFFPAEWHSSTTMPGYRWLGDLSSDQLNDWMIGLSIFIDLAATEQEKQPVREAVNRVMSRFIDNDLRIIDVDGKVTLWGNFSPSLPHEKLNALLGLSNLKIAFHVTGEEKFDRRYHDVIRNHRYAEEAQQGKVLYPEQAINRSDDNLGVEACYMLLGYEKDPALRQSYHIALERHWMMIQRENDPVTSIIREARFPGRNSITENTWKALASRTVEKRPMEKAAMRTENGPVFISGYSQGAPYYYLRSYWLARYHGFLGEEN